MISLAPFKQLENARVRITHVRKAVGAALARIQLSEFVELFRDQTIPGASVSR
jgi:hypothetical protein